MQKDYNGKLASMKRLLKKSSDRLEEKIDNQESPVLSLVASRPRRKAAKINYAYASSDENSLSSVKEKARPQKKQDTTQTSSLSILNGKKGATNKGNIILKHICSELSTTRNQLTKNDKPALSYAIYNALLQKSFYFEAADAGSSILKISQTFLDIKGKAIAPLHNNDMSMVHEITDHIKLSINNQVKVQELKTHYSAIMQNSQKGQKRKEHKQQYNSLYSKQESYHERKNANARALREGLTPDDKEERAVKRRKYEKEHYPTVKEAYRARRRKKYAEKQDNNTSQVHVNRHIERQRSDSSLSHVSV